MEIWRFNRDTKPQTFYLFYFKHSKFQNLLHQIELGCQLCNLLLRVADHEAKYGRAKGPRPLDGLVWIRVDSRDVWAFYVDLLSKIQLICPTL